jgi:hypothetical protein|nr:MAG TPA: protein of unknown function (DUF3127) [Caudoviricetes sp.]
MEAIYIEGQITTILPENRGMGQKGEWVSQDFVLKTEDNYPKNICFTIFGADKIKEANIRIGDVVSIGVNLESREFNGRWYTAIKAWSVKRKFEAQAAKQAPPAPTPQPSQPTQNYSSINQSAADALPF